VDEPSTSARNADLVRGWYQAYAAGDTETLLGFFSPDLEWTYLDPAFEDPEPRVCYGRAELVKGMRRLAARGLPAQLEEVLANGDRVLVVVHTPGLDRMRVRQAADRNFDVLTVTDGQITALRACRDRAEALAVAGITT
jgi:hypothetical protein